MGFRHQSGRMRVRYDAKYHLWTAHKSNGQCYAVRRNYDDLMELLRRYWQNHVLVR